MELWEIVHSRSGAPDPWHWRQKDAARELFRQSSGFGSFVSCLADARAHGLDFTAHVFRVVQE